MTTFEERLLTLYRDRGRFSKSSFDRFLKLGLPKRNQEGFASITLRDLYTRTLSSALPPPPSREELASFIYPECRNSYLVFSNGSFLPELSCLKGSSAVVLPLSQALSPFAQVLHSRMEELLKEESDPFAAVHGALWQEGLFLYLPPDCTLSQPVQILQWGQAETKEECALFPRLHLFLGKRARASIVFTTHLSHCSPSYWASRFVDLVLEEEAELEWTDLTEGGPLGWHFDAFRAKLQRASVLKHLYGARAPLQRLDLRCSLQGAEAKAFFGGFCLLTEKERAHFNIVMEHRAPATHSLQKVKASLDGASFISSEGKIHVHKEALLTEAYQRNHALLLSPEARAESRPSLEIFADDVKASHGSTIGGLRPEELLYLQTRGLSKSEAASLLRRGFCKEVIDEIAVGSARKRALSWLSQ